jgi:hypothetical protein
MKLKVPVLLHTFAIVCNLLDYVTYQPTVRQRLGKDVPAETDSW